MGEDDPAAGAEEVRLQPDGERLGGAAGHSILGLRQGKCLQIFILQIYLELLSTVTWIAQMWESRNFLGANGLLCQFSTIHFHFIRPPQLLILKILACRASMVSLTGHISKTGQNAKDRSNDRS